MPEISSSFSRALLLPKLSPPRLPPALVARECLLALLEQAQMYALTLVSASVGFGKTTLLSSWAIHCVHPVAWLSLDEQDNDSVRFWVYVIAALRTRAPSLGEILWSTPSDIPSQLDRAAFSILLSGGRVDQKTTFCSLFYSTLREE